MTILILNFFSVVLILIFECGSSDFLNLRYIPCLKQLCQDFLRVIGVKCHNMNWTLQLRLNKTLTINHSSVSDSETKLWDSLWELRILHTDFRQGLGDLTPWKSLLVDLILSSLFYRSSKTICTVYDPDILILTAIAGSMTL